MKKLIIMAIVGVMMLTLLVGCSNPKDVNKVSVTVDVEVDEFGWTQYTFKADEEDRSGQARKVCEENYYSHLDDGKTVSEIIQTSDKDGKEIYYFKVAG